MPNPIAYPYPQRMPSAPEMPEASKSFNKTTTEVEQEKYPYHSLAERELGKVQQIASYALASGVWSLFYPAIKAKLEDMHKMVQQSQAEPNKFKASDDVQNHLKKLAMKEPTPGGPISREEFEKRFLVEKGMHIAAAKEYSKTLNVVLYQSHNGLWYRGMTEDSVGIMFPSGDVSAYSPEIEAYSKRIQSTEASAEFKKAAETIQEYAKRQAQSTESANAEIFAGAVNALNMPRRPTVEEMAEKIQAMCERISRMLQEKNSSYASSVFFPSNILSPLSAIDAIRVRIDDKLTRMKNGHAYKCENDILDVIGYFICELVVRDMETPIKSCEK